MRLGRLSVDGGGVRLCAYIIAALPVVYAYERVAVWTWQVMA